MDPSWQEKLETPLLSNAEKQGRDFLAPRGLLPLFEGTKTMHGFDRVYASWRTAYFSYMVEKRGKKLLMAVTPDERQKEFFFFELAIGKEPEIAVRESAPLIYERVRTGDVEFLKRISNELAKRDRRRRKHLSMALLSAWLHGFLWLLSRQDRLTLIERFGFKRKVTLDGVELARKRLGLLSWADFDCYPQAPFKLGPSAELIVPDELILPD
jgi:hypothetical protein